MGTVPFFAPYLFLFIFCPYRYACFEKRYGAFDKRYGAFNLKNKGFDKVIRGGGQSDMADFNSRGGGRANRYASFQK